MRAVQGNQPDLAAEAKKLGDNANDRIRAASLFANKFFPESVMPAIERMCETSEGILAMEAIMEAMKDSTGATDTASLTSQTEADLQEMMRDERYWSNAKRDPNWVKQVDEGFKKLYG